MAAPDQVMTPDKVMTPDDVAEILRLKRTTALDYMRRGVIPAFKLGRRWYSYRSRLARHLASVPGNSYPD